MNIKNRLKIQETKFLICRNKGKKNLYLFNNIQIKLICCNLNQTKKSKSQPKYRLKEKKYKESKKSKQKKVKR